MAIPAGWSGGQGDVYCIVGEVYCVVVPELRELSCGTVWKFRLGGQCDVYMRNIMHCSSGTNEA